MEQIKTLIPLSEFVNHVKQLEKPIEQPFEAFKLFHLGLIFRYTTFLEKPLELWQFVPVGDNNEILEEPYKNSDLDKPTISLSVDAYNKAKERCLFEGFEVEKLKLQAVKTHAVSHNKILSAYWKDSVTKEWSPSLGLRKVEDLAIFGLPLTAQAIKQILG